MLYVKQKKFDYASIGESVHLEEGDTLKTVLFSKDVPSLTTAVVAGWRYHKGQAYVQLDLDAEKSQVGTGFFDTDGSPP